MKKASLVIVFFSTLFISTIYGQENLIDKIIPTTEVKTAFEKDFPNAIPEWTQDFGGEDLDHIRFKAKFKTNTTEELAVYDKLGDLKAYEILIPKTDIPSNSIRYLNSHYENFTISEAAKVKDENNITTYEVGIIRDEIFYDIVFDQNGDFLKIVEKD